jgi:hypothetical protein
MSHITIFMGESGEDPQPLGEISTAFPLVPGFKVSRFQNGSASGRSFAKNARDFGRRLPRAKNARSRLLGASSCRH